MFRWMTPRLSMRSTSAQIHLVIPSFLALSQCLIGVEAAIGVEVIGVIGTQILARGDGRTTPRVIGRGRRTHKAVTATSGHNKRGVIGAPPHGMRDGRPHSRWDLGPRPLRHRSH